MGLILYKLNSSFPGHVLGANIGLQANIWLPANICLARKDFFL
jgi:hypothetical protein